MVYCELTLGAGNRDENHIILRIRLQVQHISLICFAWRVFLFVDLREWDSLVLSCNPTICDGQSR